MQYPINCELTIIHNEQFSPKVLCNKTRTHSKNLMRKSSNVKQSSLFLSLPSVYHDLNKLISVSQGTISSLGIESVVQLV